MKKKILFSFLLGMMLLSFTTSCEKEEAEQTTEKNDNQNGQGDAKGDDNQKQDDSQQGGDNGQGGEAPAGGDGNQDVLTPPIVVTVDADGNADGEHSFTKIDENNFYIDGIKYTVSQDFLMVTGYNSASFEGEAKIISQLNYAGREMQVKEIGEKAFKQCTGLTSVIISEGVTRIEDSAFSHCTGLTSVTIPSSVTSFGLYVLSGCSSLTSITVADGNPTYDSRENCNAIISTRSNSLIAGCKNTTIPSSVTIIGEKPFSDTGLTSVTIPSSVTIIYDYAFSNCAELSSITVEDSNPMFDSRENCNAIIYTYDNTLAVGCKNTIIPSSVTSIRGYAFTGCTSLTSVTIPSSVTSIGQNAFQRCDGLTDVFCYAETLPNTGKSIFSGVNTANMTLHVPASAINAYKTTAPWSGFGSIVAIQ